MLKVNQLVVNSYLRTRDAATKFTDATIPDVRRHLSVWRIHEHYLRTVFKNSWLELLFIHIVVQILSSLTKVHTGPKRRWDCTVVWLYYKVSGITLFPHILLQIVQNFRWESGCMFGDPPYHFRVFGQLVVLSTILLPFCAGMVYHLTFISGV